MTLRGFDGPRAPAREASRQQGHFRPQVPQQPCFLDSYGPGRHNHGRAGPWLRVLVTAFGAVKTRKTD
jgi:hypothetical protein